ncbi:MAG: NUDIX domain-containing protein [Gammaproteobacteria bacterium]|nr:NUDIX domain-containing protein [Gammaproteobacteria bacterium]
MQNSRNSLHQDRSLQADGYLHGVIVACQDEKCRWLMIRRSENVVAPLKICFPGGGIEENESQSEAVVREMREELDAIVQPVACVWSHCYEERAVKLWGWLAELQPNKIRPNPSEVAEVLWLTADEAVNHPDALPRTADFLSSLLDYRTNRKDSLQDLM